MYNKHKLTSGQQAIKKKCPFFFFLMFKLWRSTLAKRIRAGGCLVVVRQGVLALVVEPHGKHKDCQAGGLGSDFPQTLKEWSALPLRESVCLDFGDGTSWDSVGVTEQRWSGLNVSSWGREEREASGPVGQWSSAVNWRRQHDTRQPLSKWVSGDLEGRSRVRAQVRIQVYR